MARFVRVRAAVRVLLLFLVVACAEPSSTLGVVTDPEAQPPLGVGLAQLYRVTDIRCDEPPVDACNELNPATLEVSVVDPIAAVSVNTTFGTFTLTGLAA